LLGFAPHAASLQNVLGGSGDTRIALTPNHVDQPAPLAMLPESATP
jgi:hypothetical protein